MTLATPLPFVVAVADAKLPPLVDDDQVTVCPALRAAFPLASDSCAVIVSCPPTEMAFADDATMYFAGGPATVATAAELPVSDELSVAMIV